MALKTSPEKTHCDESKTESPSNKGENNETKKMYVPEYTKKSKENKKRNYKNQTGSSKVNTTLALPSTGIPSSVYYGQPLKYAYTPILPTSYPVLRYPQYLGPTLLYDYRFPNPCIPNPLWSFYEPPLSVFHPNLVSPQIFPVSPHILLEPMFPVVPPIAELASPFIRDFRSSTNVYNQRYVESLIEEPTHSNKVVSTTLNQKENDSIEFYLTLPKSLFPTGRMLAVDPNPLIDEFCKQVDIYKHTSWILDLELGVPRAPITRPIATYDVQFNSVHCKNTPGAIHPGFESCDQAFKRAFLFYYDCVISSWYRGYVILTSDESVANFQYWLQFPMQLLGMCWR